MLFLRHRSICCQVLCQVRNQVALTGHAGGAVGETGRCRRIDAGSAVHEVRVETGFFNLLVSQVAGQLVDNGSYHLQVAQFFRTY